MLMATPHHARTTVVERALEGEAPAAQALGARRLLDADLRLLPVDAAVEDDPRHAEELGEAVLVALEDRALGRERPDRDLRLERRVLGRPERLQRALDVLAVAKER